MQAFPSNRSSDRAVSTELQEKHIEALQIKIMNASKKAEKTIDQSDGLTTKQLIFTRALGHKNDIPGLGQWRMVEDSSEGCWVCDKEIYSLIFWN